MSERADQIADGIAQVIRTDDDPQDVFDALFRCTVFALTLVCPDCRKRMAASISGELLETAEQWAAETADLEPIYDQCPHPRLN
jgi:hypothetical protein